MERYITDTDGCRTAVVLDIEEYEALVEAAEDAEDARAVDEVREAIACGEDEMIPYREARKEWTEDNRERIVLPALHSQAGRKANWQTAA